MDRSEHRDSWLNANREVRNLGAHFSLSPRDDAPSPRDLPPVVGVLGPVSGLQTARGPIDLGPSLVNLEGSPMTPDQLGPLASLVLEVPAGATPHRGLRHVLELVDHGQIRLLDVELLRREDGNTLSVVAPQDWADYLGDLAADLIGTMSGLLDESDRLLLTADLGEDSIALVLVYEWLLTLDVPELWAGDGIRVISEDSLTAIELLDALERTESAATASIEGAVR